jgi:hypothetical protein
MNNDPIDDLLALGGSFDWITPTLAFIQDFFNGPVADFGIPAGLGWDRGDIKRLLKRHRLGVWGLMYNVSGDMLMFSVRAGQAGQVYDILRREGVPVLYAPNAAM